MPVSLAIFLWRNSSLIKSQNLLENPLLFPTQITNLLFVIKNRQPLKQNFMLNCMESSKEKRMLSATEQNQTYNHSFFFRRLHTIQLNIFYQSGVCVPGKFLVILFLHRMFLDGVLFVLLIYKIVVIFLLVVL